MLEKDVEQDSRPDERDKPRVEPETIKDLEVRETDGKQVVGGSKFATATSI